MHFPVLEVMVKVILGLYALISIPCRPLPDTDIKKVFSQVNYVLHVWAWFFLLAPYQKDQQ